MGLHEQQHPSHQSEFREDEYGVEELSHKKKIKRLLEEKLERKRLKDEFKDEFEDDFDEEFDWSQLDK
ncbi:MAG: hypothetical protein H0U75_12410 [Legionella sp.]|nr:hypothetical protein [Legionella sp.]